MLIYSELWMWYWFKLDIAILFKSVIFFPGFSWSEIWISASSYNNRRKGTRHDARVCARRTGGSRVIRQVVQERYEYSAACLYPPTNQHHPYKLQQQGIKDNNIM